MYLLIIMNKDLLYRFFDGSVTEHEVGQVRAWVETSKENRRELFRERKIFDAMLLLADTNKQTERTRYRLGHKWDIRLRIPQIAAMLAVVFGLGLLVNLRTGQDGRHQTAARYEIVAPPGAKSQVRLIDGSMVWLNAGSRLQYAADFGQQKREVRLEGEAYFEVAKHKERPFVVMSGEQIKIEVLGTKFNVQAWDGCNQIVTTLEEGSVRFSAGNKQITLTPEQQLIYYTDKAEYNITQVDTDIFTAWKEQVFRYNSITMQELCNELEKIYDVHINLSARLENIVVSGSLEYRHDIDQVLNIMEKRMHFNWKRKGNIIILQ